MSMIGEYTETHLVGVAKSVVEKKTKDSTVLDTRAEDRIPKFENQGVSICCSSCAGHVLPSTSSSDGLDDILYMYIYIYTVCAYVCCRLLLLFFCRATNRESSW